MTESVDIKQIAVQVLENEAKTIAKLCSYIGPEFEHAVMLLLHCQGKVVVTGIGKSGHIGRKLAATLTSTGTRAVFMHAAEAAHGDLGIIAPNDVVIVLSNSGITAEIIDILPIINDIGAPIIAITGDPESPLAKASKVVLSIKIEREADPRGLVPTSSAVAMLALGDALAMAVSLARGFTVEDFLRLHPKGRLGQLGQSASRSREL